MATLSEKELFTMTKVYWQPVYEAYSLYGGLIVFPLSSLMTPYFKNL